MENVKSKATLSWYKENRLLSSINITDLNYLCLEYKDKGNYSCVISNSLISETKYLIISEVCAEKSHTLEIIVGALALFVLALVIYFYIRIQRRQEVASMNSPGSNPASPLLPWYLYHTTELNLIGNKSIRRKRWESNLSTSDSSSLQTLVSHTEGRRALVSHQIGSNKQSRLDISVKDII